MRPAELHSLSAEKGSMTENVSSLRSVKVAIHEKSSLAPPGQSLAFSLGDEKGFEWIGAYDITADELLADRHRQDREQDRTGANAHSGTACGRKAYAERRVGKGSQ